VRDPLAFWVYHGAQPSFTSVGSFIFWGARRSDGRARIFREGRQAVSFLTVRWILLFRRSAANALPFSLSVCVNCWKRSRFCFGPEFIRCAKVCDMSHHRRRPAKSWKRVCCHSFRATGVTEYMNSGGTIEIAQRIAGYTSPATTRIYDRSGDRLTLKRSRECRSGRDKRIEFRAYVPVWIDAESVPGRGVDPTIDVCAINRSTGFSISLQRLRGIVVNACPIVV
jgi:hypothetical protein